MRSRDVVGKRITSISQQRFWDETTREWAVSFFAIRLEDGSGISLIAQEAEDQPYVSASYLPPHKGE